MRKIYLLKVKIRSILVLHFKQKIQLLLKNIALVIENEGIQARLSLLFWVSFSSCDYCLNRNDHFSYSSSSNIVEIKVIIKTHILYKKSLRLNQTNRVSCDPLFPVTHFLKLKFNWEHVYLFLCFSCFFKVWIENQC